MANKVYKISLDDREFKQKLRELQQMSARTQQIMQRNLNVTAGGLKFPPIAFRMPELASSSKGIDELRSKLIELKKAVDDNTESTKKYGFSLENMAKGFGGFLSLKTAEKFVTQLVSIRGEFQQLEIAFGTMLGNAEEAQKLIGQLAQTAATTPFQLGEVTQGAKQLMAYGVAAEEINDKLLMLGDIASGLSLPLGDLIYLYGTTMTQGRMFTQDLRQFMGRGIPLAEELAKQFGVTKDKVGELVTAGKVGAKEFNAAMESMRTDRFNNLMTEQSKSVTGQIANIQDGIEMMFNEIGKSSEGVINTTLKGVAWMVEHYKVLGKVIASVVSAYGIYRAAVIANAAIVAASGRSFAVLARYIRMATVAQLKFNKSAKANPYVLLASAVASVISAIIIFADRTDAATKAQENMTKSLEAENEALEERKRKGEEAIRTIKDENATRYEQEQALNTLQLMYPEFFENLDLEKAKTIELTGLIKQLTLAREQDTIKMKEQRVGELRSKLSNRYELSKLNATEVLALSQELRLAENDLAKTRSDMYESKLTNEQKYIRERDRIRFLERDRNNLIKQQEKQREENAKRYGKLYDPSTDPSLNLLQRQIDTIDDSLSKARTNLEGFTNVKTRTINDEIGETRSRITQLNKEISDLRAGGGERGDATFSDAIEQRQKELKELNSKLETLTGKSTTKSPSTTSKQSAKKEIDERVRYEESIRKEAQRQANALALEGLDGLALIEERYQQAMRTIADSKQEYMQKFKATEVQANALYYEHERQAREKRQKDEEDYYKELQDKYATYSQQRVEIAKRYEADIKALKERGDEDRATEAQKAKEEELKALDLQFAMKSKEFEAWTERVATLSIDEIIRQIIEIEAALKASELSGDSSDVLAQKRASLIKLREQLSVQNRSTTKRGVKEWQELHKTLVDVGNQFTSLGNDIGGTLGEVIASAGQLTQSTIAMVDGIITLSTTGIEAIKTAADAGKKAVAALEASTLILAVISAGLRVMQQLSKWFNKNTDISKEQKEEYKSLIRVTDELVEANKRLMNSLSGDELQRRYNDTLELVKKRAKATRDYIDKYLQSGEKHSLFGRKIGDSEGDKLSIGLAKYKKELESIIGKTIGTKVVMEHDFWGKRLVAGLDISWLSDITSEQINELKNYTHIWASLGEEVQNYLNDIADARKQADELLQSNYENITGTTEDRIKSDIWNIIDEMQDGVEMIPKSFEEMMRNALKRGLNDTEFANRIKAFYKMMAEYGKDGYDKQEADALKAEYETIIEEQKRKYQEQLKVLGINDPSFDDPRKAEEKGIATASQDSIDRLEGLWALSVQIQDTHSKRFATYSDAALDLQVKGWQDVRAIRELAEKIEQNTSSTDVTLKDISVNGIPRS